jgi:hypothetical protein
MFEFSASSLRELEQPLNLDADEVADLLELLDGSGLDIRRAQLLFNAREESFSAARFHAACNGKKNTVTLVRSTNKRLFGGYASNPWNSGGAWEKDPKAFLFSVTRKSTHPLFSNFENALYMNGSYGPTWGGNHDLHLSDNCGSNASSYSQLGYSYQSTDPHALAGAREFTVDNYLVLHLE